MEVPAQTFERLLAELKLEMAPQEESPSSKAKPRTFSVQRGSLDFEIEDLFFNQDDEAISRQETKESLNLGRTRTSLVFNVDGGDEDRPNEPTNKASSMQHQAPAASRGTSTYTVPTEQPVRPNGELLDIRPV